jgi:hypothetical protein
MSTTVASGERSFIDMKRMKNFGKSAMSREKLNVLIMFYVILTLCGQFISTIIEDLQKTNLKKFSKTI